MATHKSAIKRIRSNEKKAEINKYQHKTTRTAIQKLRETTDKKELGVCVFSGKPSVQRVLFAKAY